MKFGSYILALTVALTFAANVNAQNKEVSVLPEIKNEIGNSATSNIENAERLFCYKVAPKPQNYNGYTINNMAITGFCGVIDENLQQMITEQFLASENNIDFINTDNCTIQPKIMLRYVRGIDNTDVLLSSPCHSISIFYAGTLKTFNMKPATELVDTVVNAFKSSQTKFVSPALLNQLLPIGVAQTAEHKALLNQNTQPKRNWTSDTPTQAKQQPGGAWNSLNFN